MIKLPLAKVWYALTSWGVSTKNAAGGCRARQELSECTQLKMSSSTGPRYSSARLVKLSCALPERDTSAPQHIRAAAAIV
eukprot:6479320-Amphidinium_carterae.1